MAGSQGRLGLFVAFNEIFESLFGLGIDRLCQLFPFVFGSLIFGMHFWEIFGKELCFYEFQPYFPVDEDCDYEYLVEE